MQSLTLRWLSHWKVILNYSTLCFKQTKFCTDSKQWNFSDFLVFASKIATILRLQSAALVTEKFFDSRLRQLKKARLFACAILRCCKRSKKAFSQAERALGIKQFYKHGRQVKLRSMLSKFKNKLKTNEAENRQKINNSQSQLKIYWFIYS